MRFDLESYLADVRQRLTDKLHQVLPDPGEADPQLLRSAIQASVLDGGKRLRPCLTVAACEAVGGTADQALGPACAVEMIHCYSLVHDDLPAMDDDDMRRGKPTCHKRFGEATAILAGDALLTQAFDLMASEGLASGASPQAMLRAIQVLARGSGVYGMVGGQALDMQLKGSVPSFDLLEQCHADKTAALFFVSTTIGALVGGGSERDVESLGEYGRDLGLAFQHADDLRDADYPEYFEQSLKRSEELAGKAANAAESFGEAGAPLVALALLVRERAREADHGELPTRH